MMGHSSGITLEATRHPIGLVGRRLVRGPLVVIRPPGLPDVTTMFPPEWYAGNVLPLPFLGKWRLPIEPMPLSPVLLSLRVPFHITMERCFSVYVLTSPSGLSVQEWDRS